MKLEEKLKLIMDIIDKQKDLLELYETMIKEYAETIECQKKEIKNLRIRINK